jgi:NAD(P)-dependent dehydrogenase (short-subunit alcohol dehydrogenase family)
MNDNATRVLITGASGGIGYELAKVFAHAPPQSSARGSQRAQTLTQFTDELQRRFGVFGEKPLHLIWQSRALRRFSSTNCSAKALP